MIQRVLERASLLRFRRSLRFCNKSVAVPLLFSCLLAGCSLNSNLNDSSTIVESIMPEARVTDYRSKGCDAIWNIVKPTAMENSLYWLRLMDCADKLSSADAREMVKQWVPGDWSQVFKQSILINRATPSLAERHKIIENLNQYSVQFPVSLRSLLQLWRGHQYLKVNLIEQKSKYQRLQFDSDAKIDRLKDIQVNLESEVHSIKRKLENLTDIERQLSSRKQGQNVAPDPHETGDSRETGQMNKDNNADNSKPETKSNSVPETKTPTTKNHSSEKKGAESQ